MISKLLKLVSVSMMLSSCAFSQLHEDGSQTHIGFLYLKIPAPEYSHAGAIVESANIGAIGLITPAGSGVSIGYTKKKVGVLKDHSAVFLNSK